MVARPRNRKKQLKKGSLNSVNNEQKLSFQNVWLKIRENVFFTKHIFIKLTFYDEIILASHTIDIFLYILIDFFLKLLAYLTTLL